jgi:hypothetical protein
VGQESVKVCCKRIAHYCHLVFWMLVRRFMDIEEYQTLMGPNFKQTHSSGVMDNSRVRSSHNLVWYSLDEAAFELPVDLSNIPAAVSENGGLESQEAHMLVANVHR